VGWDMLNPEMVMIGTKKGNPDTAVLAKKLESMYLQMCDNMPRVEIGSWEEVEAIKIFYNTFISAKLSLVNMIQDVAVKLGNMNVDVVTNALANSTHRITSGKYMKPGMGDGGPCHPRDNIALRFLAKKLDLHYDLFSAIMESREIQAKNMAKEILKYGNVVYFTSDSYKEGTQLTDGSYSLLVQHYVRELGGIVSHGNAEKIDVIFRVHNNDQFSTDENTIVFDPWRTYPKAKNVVYYGDTKNV
jgi:UDPglucose 6-dehydrogenase